MGNEQVFKFPGFFEREIDLTQRVKAPLGIPAGVIGTAEKGPAFVPVTVGSISDFQSKFGKLDPKRFGPYAVNEFLKHRTAATFLRVLGAGANDTTSDIEATRVRGTVKNAGFVVATTGTLSADQDLGTRAPGTVVFLAAKHSDSNRVTAPFGFPVFTDNDSFGSGTNYHIVRGMIMLATGTRMLVMDGNENLGASYNHSDDVATLGSTGPMNGKFKLVISSSVTTFGTSDNVQGIRVLTASLNPTDNDYIAKILNTNPDKFSTEQHLLYADFAVEDELAAVSTTSGSIMLMSGSSQTSTTSGITSLTFNNMYGRFDTRFTTPSTTWFISQPYGNKEINLFKFESLSDGAWANDKIKVSIANIRKSTDPQNDYGTFAVQVRVFDDTDLNPKILEQYPNCNLDPSSDIYIGKVIGDSKAYYMFDADSEDERRIVVKGRFPNKSSYIRVVIDEAVEKKITPATALPFGFRGPEVINTSDRLGDISGSIVASSSLPVGSKRLYAYITGFNNLSGSVIPPLPYTYKATRGVAYTANPSFAGHPGSTEITDARIYWGAKTTRIAPTGSLTDSVLNPNASSVTNTLAKAYTKFLGIAKLDALVTGSSADLFNNNKFTLARVALSTTTVASITGTAAQHMREAVYIRNGSPNFNDGRIVDPIDSSKNRVTLGTLVNLTSSVDFNRFSSFAKFTNLLYGGFDGVNILDQNASRLNDRAASSDLGGGAASAFTSPGLSTNVNGIGKQNGTVFSYRTAASIMTDELTVNTNILAIPGMRDSYITDHAADSCKKNGLIFYVQDVVEYDENLNRLFDDSSAKPDVRQTVEQFESRAIDNNYVAAYFPDVIINDVDNNKRIQVPASIAAMGALAFNDRVGFPWFAPAGFNRAGLDFVTNTDVRLGSDDRAKVSDARINPVVHFPRSGTTPTFVIWGQKTLQAAKSALDRVNVRRMMLELKRIVVTITREGFVFEQNTAETRKKWVSQITPRLGLILAQQGIESFRVIMDESNNSTEDVENNRLNGKIIVVPTRSIEAISVDFILTNSGVSFAE